ncbi:hypothetical protein MRX96_021568 [Rhipicephalus microplus]
MHSRVAQLTIEGITLPWQAALTYLGLRTDYRLTGAHTVIEYRGMLRRRRVFQGPDARTLTQATARRRQRAGDRPAATDAVLYYLGGYIVKKASRFSDCDDCKATVKGSGNVPAAAILTEMRSFVPGALQHPSDALTCLLSGIEQVIEENTEVKQVFGDLFWSILEDLSKKSLVRVGCDVHSEEFSARVIKSYLVTRMYFYSRFLQRERALNVQVKSARKRAKLL